MLVYDNPRLAREIEFDFLNAGLSGQEHCIYLTTKDRIMHIKHQMMLHGINAECYLKTDFLRIYEIPDLTKHSGGILRGFENFMNTIMNQSKPPYRIGRIITN